MNKPMNPQIFAEQQVAQARRAAATYNDLHTAAWHLVGPQGSPVSAECKQAFATLAAGRTTLAQVRQSGADAAVGAGWDWPAQAVAPWQPGGVRPVGKRTKRTFPAVVVITAAERKTAPERVAVQDTFNGLLLEARLLGKPANWLPLRAARAALGRLPAGEQLTMLLG